MKNIDIYRYDKFIKRICILCVLPVLYVAVYLLTKDETAKISLLQIIIPIIIAFVFVMLIINSRKIFLGTLIISDVDMKTLYELDKKKDTPKNREHNLCLLNNVYFYGGEFLNSINCGNEILSISTNQDTRFATNHKMILSKFILGDYSCIQSLIEEQRTVKIKNLKQKDIYLPYYDFILNYINGDYENAVNLINRLDEIFSKTLLNNNKITACFLKAMAYEKMNNAEELKNCINEINKIDKNHNTYFSKAILNSNAD